MSYWVITHARASLHRELYLNYVHFRLVRSADTVILKSLFGFGSQVTLRTIKTEAGDCKSGHLGR